MMAHPRQSRHGMIPPNHEYMATGTRQFERQGCLARTIRQLTTRTLLESPSGRYPQEANRREPSLSCLREFTLPSTNRKLRNVFSNDCYTHYPGLRGANENGLTQAHPRVESSRKTSTNEAASLPPALSRARVYSLPPLSSRDARLQVPRDVYVKHLRNRFGALPDGASRSLRTTCGAQVALNKVRRANRKCEAGVCTRYLTFQPNMEFLLGPRYYIKPQGAIVHLARFAHAVAATDETTIVLMTPGFSIAYFEHTFLAQQ